MPLTQNSRDWSSAGDTHPRVSVSSSSGPVVTPLAVTHAHNPTVVTGKRQCDGFTFPDSDGVEFGDGWPKVSPGVPHLLARVLNWGFYFISHLIRFSSSTLNPGPR
jgi:hypothetical protein